METPRSITLAVPPPIAAPAPPRGTFTEQNKRNRQVLEPAVSVDLKSYAREQLGRLRTPPDQA